VCVPNTAKYEIVLVQAGDSKLTEFYDAKQRIEFATSQPDICPLIF